MTAPSKLQHDTHNGLPIVGCVLGEVSCGAHVGTETGNRELSTVNAPRNTPIYGALSVVYGMTWSGCNSIPCDALAAPRHQLQPTRARTNNTFPAVKFPIGQHVAYVRGGPLSCPPATRQSNCGPVGELRALQTGPQSSLSTVVGGHGSGEDLNEGRVVYRVGALSCSNQNRSRVRSRMATPQKVAENRNQSCGQFLRWSAPSCRSRTASGSNAQPALPSAPPNTGCRESTSRVAPTPCASSGRCVSSWMRGVGYYSNSNWSYTEPKSRPALATRNKSAETSFSVFAAGYAGHRSREIPRRLRAPVAHRPDRDLVSAGPRQHRRPTHAIHIDHRRWRTAHRCDPSQQFAAPRAFSGAGNVQ